ncbi:hypothetical protein CspeluHIS016_0112950 [Cutaneotrichosporon spelunceum]|uniref:Uncharacterized protein n=1 Tax=Cutaneotrichosporon spelunceum TaxID=1672016 RepID=A0AAD3TQD4_9TREE|nr:hypothetical protein CspeluHIS016_0112950 [Cutaneotrichosporon spelunceum]
MQRARPKQSASRDPPRSGSHRASTPDTPATLDTPSSVRTSSIRLSRVPSPTFAELARARPGREDDALADSGDESDLDLTLPSLNAALRSRVIPSSSRLLVKMTQPSGAGSTYDDDDHNGLGWSGSESEEEEFSRTVSRIARRKSTIPAPRQLFKRPSLPAGYLHRHSDYYGSMASNQTSPSTASESHVGGPPTPTVGQRPSTSLDTSHPNQGTAALLSALVEQKYASRDALPRPKRFVQGWGAPEVLLEDDWPPDNLVASDDMAMSEYDSSTINVTAPTIPKQAVPASTRLPQPLGAAW